MRRIFLVSCIAVALAGLACVESARAQRLPDPLRPDQADQIAHLRDRPNARLELYQQYLQDRVDTIQQIGAQPLPGRQRQQLLFDYQMFTKLCDEFEDNIYTFDEAHADFRRALKKMIPALAKWHVVLSEAAPDPIYSFAQQSAVDEAQAVEGEAKQLYASQKTYFKKHKNERGTLGTGPS